MKLFPINLDLTGRLCLVIGGGHVALRKIRRLVECDCMVKVISPQVVDGITQLVDEERVILALRNYEYGDLEGAFLVFAATDNHAVQDAIASEAREKNILLNSVNNPARCDFQLPATVRRGTLLLTVSTGGASPALSRKIRLELEQIFGTEYGLVTSLFAQVREVVVTGKSISSENRRVFEALLLSGVVDRVKAKEWDAVARILQSILPSGIDTAVMVQKVSALENEYNCEQKGNA